MQGVHIFTYDIFFRGFILCALCALVGGLAFAPLTMRSAKTDGVRTITELAQRKWLSFWLIASLFSIVPAAYLRAASANTSAWTLLARLLLLVLLAELIKRHRETRWPALVLGVALLLTLSLDSRSARLPDWAIATVADWLHLTLAAVWLGGVAMLGVVIRETTRLGSEAEASEMPPALIGGLSLIVERFSPVALFCVLGLGVTGIAQAGLFVKRVETLWTTDYGRALSLKLILFGVLIGFGAFHQQVIAPVLRRAMMQRGTAMPGANELMRRFRLSLLLEMLIGTGLLLIVGVLISIPR